VVIPLYNFRLQSYSANSNTIHLHGLRNREKTTNPATIKINFNKKLNQDPKAHENIYVANGGKYPRAFNREIRK